MPFLLQQLVSEDIKRSKFLKLTVSAKPTSTKTNAFINRRRPPMKPKINVKEKTNPAMQKKTEASSPQLNIRGRTRVKGSVLRPIPHLEKDTAAKAPSIGVQTQGERKKIAEKNILSAVETEKENSSPSTNVGGEKKPRPVTRPRTRTRTRISLASLPNIVKGEKSVSQSKSKSRTRVRGRVNIRPTVELS